MLKITASFTGAINGVNKIFVLPEVYVANSVHHFYNGQLKYAVNDDGLTENGNQQVTLKEAPLSGSTLQFLYDDGLDIVFRDIAGITGTIPQTKPGKAYVELVKGAAQTVQITITDAVLNTPFSLASTTVVFRVRLDEGDADAAALITKTTADPEQARITNATAGKAEFYIDTGDTLTLAKGYYSMDVIVTMSDGLTKYRAYRGVLVLLA